MSHDADLLQQRQHAVDGGDVGLADRLGQLLCGEGSLLGSYGVEDRGVSLADGATLVAEPERDRSRVDQVAGVLAPNGRHP